jgi:hypothetical protein
MKYGGKMLDKTILSHVESMDDLEENIKKDIERMTQAIDIKDLMEDPQTVLLEFTQTLNDYLKEQYYDKATEAGFKFAEMIKEDNDISIPRTDDPKLNEDEFD